MANRTYNLIMAQVTDNTATQLAVGTISGYGDVAYAKLQGATKPRPATVVKPFDEFEVIDENGITLNFKPLYEARKQLQELAKQGKLSANDGNLYGPTTLMIPLTDSEGTTWRFRAVYVQCSNRRDKDGTVTRTSLAPKTSGDPDKRHFKYIGMEATGKPVGFDIIN